MTAGQGLRIPRRFTEEGRDPYASIEWARRDSRITNPDGSVVFEVKDAEVPSSWSQVATDIVVSKYFRKAGVPQTDTEGSPLTDENGEQVLGGETSTRQVFDRLATTWRWWGENHGYFASPTDAQAFEDELKYMLANQIASPNSPQWFNTGLAYSYGITGTAQGFWFVDPLTGEMTESPDAYSHPAPHACFPEGIRIMTRGGHKPIEKIEEGDEVLTHVGRYRLVTSIMQRAVDEPLVTLKVTKLSAEPLTSTTNHPVLAIRGVDAKTSRQPVWIAAGDLSVGDYVVVARPASLEDIPEPVDLATFAGPLFAVTDSQLITRNAAHHPTMKRFISFENPSLFRLFGHWLGDGSLRHETRDGELSSVIFVFRGDDSAAQNDVLLLMREHFGVSAPIEHAKDQNTAHARFVRRPLARFFADMMGIGFAGKHIPSFVFDLPRAHRLELLVGLYRSDGCTLTVGNCRLICFDQSNQEVADGIWRLLRSLGYAPSVTGGTVRPGGTTPHYRVTVSCKDAIELAELCGIAVPASDAKPRYLRVGDDIAYRVEATTSEPFYGTVYNFQVEEDESYVANGIAVHNCFINSVKDDLVNPGGIMDLWVREARLFKMGSGTGSNFSQIRAENETLSGGGKSSGVMGFLRIGDRAAGAIKSGGTTRRAAKMVILDLDHPDVEEFIDWKMHEEDKARVLIQHGGYAADFNGEAYSTVSGQNSNNSVRVPNEFIEAVRNDNDWHLTDRTSGQIRKTLKARDLWRKVAEAAWACADPGVQFDTIINEWHTSPAGGKIRATNPCAEYVFLDDTACNLASINLIKFFDDANNTFDVEGYEHAIRLWTMVLEISVTMAHFPSREIAQGSYDYRTLGLGYANLGTLLMRMGLPYDSDRGRAVSGAITAILTGYGYATSAEISAAVGPFTRFAENREAMLRVIRNHRRAAYNADQSEFEGLSHCVMGIDPERTPTNLLVAARQSWDLALDMGERHGFRNAQLSVVAPTGTIGLQMDCDTTGVEPDFALVKFKKLAGGGYFKIVNQSVAPALRNLGYDERQINDIIRYIVGTSSLEGAPHINPETLMAKGFEAEDLAKIEASLPAVFELKHAFNPFVLGEATMQKLGFTPDEYATFEFDLLRALGFSQREIREATEWVCGEQTIEGAPLLKEEHLAVFDTANRNGRNGRRLIQHTGHIRMLAATQPFLSGAASKTINMPNEATIEDIEESYMLSYELGVKCMALYRDGSKASQPLSASSDDGQSDEETEEITMAHEFDKQILWGKIPAGLSPTQAYAQGMHPPRFLLPSRRGGYTQEAKIGGHKVYLRTGEYEDGTLGELFIDLAKEGATLRGILSCFAIAVSKGLQFGVPLEEFVDTFTFQTFEPRGMVEGHPNIKMANSIVDYVFRALAVEYLRRDDLAQVPPVRDGELPEPASGMAVEAGVQLDLTDAAAEQDVNAVATAVKFLDSTPISPQERSDVGGSTPKGGAGSSLTTKSAPVAMIAVAVGAKDAGTAAMQAALENMMGDAPLCDTCGHITIRNGSCYKCLNCGNSLGCS